MLFRVYLGMVTCFWSTFVRGRGVMWHSMVYIWVPAGITLSRVSVMHQWATLGCDVFSCHSNLVNHVRGSMSTPSRKSIAHRPLCAEISSSSDV